MVSSPFLEAKFKEPVLKIEQRLVVIEDTASIVCVMFSKSISLINLSFFCAR